VRRAAAEAIAAMPPGDADATRFVRTALETCAATDRSAEVATRCRALLEPAANTRSSQSGETLDAMVMAGDEDTVAASSGFAVVMSDGVIRVGTTGPGGWIHERPAPAGSYVVLDPDTLAPEP
jgi:hypothetical protein